jgi:putative flippase GtrA
VPFVLLSFAGLVISTLAVHLASAATIDTTRLFHTAAVEAANVAAYGVLWIVQFVLCDRILFRTPSEGSEDVVDVVVDQSVSIRQTFSEHSTSGV